MRTEAAGEPDGGRSGLELVREGLFENELRNRVGLGGDLFALIWSAEPERVLVGGCGEGGLKAEADPWSF